MAGDERDTVAGHLIGDGHRLLRVAGIVADVEVELLAEHAARFVDVLDGHLAAILHLRAEGGILTRDRADDGDRRGIALLAAAASSDQGGLSEGCDQPGHTLHCYLPLKDWNPLYINLRVEREIAQLRRSRQVSGLVRS